MYEDLRENSLDEVEDLPQQVSNDENCGNKDFEDPKFDAIDRTGRQELAESPASSSENNSSTLDLSGNIYEEQTQPLYPGAAVTL